MRSKALFSLVILWLLGAAGCAGPSGDPKPVLTHSHRFPVVQAGIGEELSGLCQSWTLGNEAPLYVNTVSLRTEGGWHHSNWFFVPENYAAGPDGIWNCKDRGFSEVVAAAHGGVIFAQSTQSPAEVQRFQPGVAMRIPPLQRIVAGIHLINATGEPLETAATMELYTLRERDVRVSLAGMRLNYGDLHLPPRTRSAVTGTCNFDAPHRARLGRPLDFRLYYVLPHYHGLGTSFRLQVAGGPADGRVIVDTQARLGEPWGVMLDPPVDLTGAEGFRFTCEYDNPRNEEVVYGISDQEMCVMLGFTDSELLYAGDILEGAGQVTGVEDGVTIHSGPCDVITIPAINLGVP